jgi:hypothetical protein
MRSSAMATRLLIATVALAACSGHVTPATGQGQAPSLPARFVMVWSRPVGGSTFSAAADAVALVDPAGDLAIDSAATGRLEHLIKTAKPWRLNELQIIDNRLYTELNMPSKSEDEIAVAAYDLTTGAQIWRTMLDAGPAGFLSSVFFTATGVVVVPGSNLGPGLLEGLSAVTGKMTWSRMLGLCKLGFQVAASDTTAYAVQCVGKNQVALEAIRPSDGSLIWRLAYGATGASRVNSLSIKAVENGYILTQISNRSMQLFTSDGTQVNTPVGTITCPESWCMFQADGGQAVVQAGPVTTPSEQITPSHEIVRGFSLPEGYVRWQRSGELFAPGYDLAEENGIVYGPAGASAANTATASVLEPVFLTALQNATGRSVTLPLPVANTGASADVEGATDGLVFVSLAAWRAIAAFRPVTGPGSSTGPAILDGVNPAVWPGACALLSPTDIGHVLAAGYTSVPLKTLSFAGITWSRPVGCAFIGPVDKDPAVIAKIAWVARTAQQASALVDSYLAQEQAWGFPGVSISGGYLVSDDTLNQSKDCVLILVGRVIVEVIVPNDATAARALAPIIARKLEATSS